jgi:uncharacterized protein (DUF697 family)
MTQYEWETNYELGPAQEAEYGEVDGYGELGQHGEMEYEGVEEVGGYGETEYEDVGEVGEYGEVEEMEAAESPLHEVEEMEYAAELLEITDEQELEEFIGDLVKKAARAAGGLLRSPLGRQLTARLKKAARHALPVVGGALGTMVAPGVGTALGSKLGSLASTQFEADFEGMDQEQAEFEATRRYVQLAATAAQNAALAPPHLPPAVVAQRAVAAAARRYAPGLLPVVGYTGGPGSYGLAPPTSPGYAAGQSGRWVRRGRRIIVYGA